MIIFTSRTTFEHRMYLMIAGIAIILMLIITIIAFYPRSYTAANPPTQQLIDFTVIDSDFVKGLQPFPAVTLQGTQPGRSEPFIMYYPQTKK